MHPRSLRVAAATSVLVLALTGLSLSLAPDHSNPALASQPGASVSPNLRRLADAVGRAASTLELVSEEPLTLLDGRQLVRLKAIDPVSGEIFGATFEGDSVVGEQATRAEAGAWWRERHGALTPELVGKLATLQPDDSLDVAVWLVAKVSPLPKPDRIPPSHDADGSTSSSAPPSALPGSLLSRLSSFGIKLPALPIPADAVPPEVRARASMPGIESGGEHQRLAVEEPKDANAASPESPPPADVQAAEAFKAQNDAVLRDQIAPVRDRFLDLLAAHDLTPAYASETAPIVYLNGVTRSQVEALARLPEVDAIYNATAPGGPLLANARPTQNADLLADVGYTGSGVNLAVVEGERMSTVNPYLSVTQVRDPSYAPRPHPTGVGGIVRSTHSIVRGLATGVSLYSANGDNYSTVGALSDALDWGRDQATVLNNSYWVEDNGSSSSLFAMDRHMDYIVRYNFDFAAVASGNFRMAGCSSPASSSSVTTPGKGYNSLTVGNYEDDDTLGWSGDNMNTCSSYNVSGRYKPEVAAVGSTISSTLSSTVTTIGGIGSGTSYASPMVAAVAADMIQADGSLASRPESLRAIIMATALHNIEGDAQLSREDGVGGMVASAAMASVERGNWDSRSISSGTSFPITYTQFVYEGERVRFVIDWLSNPDAAYTTDPLPADLDLTARRADGSFIESSVSGSNSFEIVDFVAPASETYQFVVSLFGGYSGSSTRLGAGWWRGTYRVAPEVGYGDPAASPLGTHLSVYPTDWSPINYWRAFGIRSNSSDHDLRLSTASWFEDPSTRSTLASSTYGTGQVDFTLVDGNHRSSSLPEHYRVYKFGGTGGYSLSWSNPGVAVNAAGWYGPYNMSSDQVVKVFDVRFNANHGRRISVVPDSSSNDLAVALFASSGGASSTWTQSRSQYVKVADAFGTGNSTEQLSYLHTGAAADWLGLVVYSKVQAAASFYLYVEDLNIYLPVVLKQ